MTTISSTAQSSVSTKSEGYKLIRSLDRCLRIMAIIGGLIFLSMLGLIIIDETGNTPIINLEDETLAYTMAYSLLLCVLFLICVFPDAKPFDFIYVAGHKIVNPRPNSISGQNISMCQPKPFLA